MTTRKTTPPADQQPDTQPQQTEASERSVNEAAAPVITHANPQKGGRFIRQPDGTLKPA